MHAPLLRHRSARVLAVAALAALACRLNLGGPDLPSGGPQASDRTATEAASAWEQALADARTTGRLTIIVSEAQLTSSLAARAASGDSWLRSPQVSLRDGEILVYGVVRQDPFEANVRLSIAPVVDAEGHLGFELGEADFGPLPASQGLRRNLSAMLSEVLAGPLGSLATGFRVTSVAVADGELAIVAELR